MLKASLRTKLLAMTSTLLFLAVAAYLILAVSMFNEDKSTYVFEGNATLVNTLAAETTTNLQSIAKTVELFSVTASQGTSNSQIRDSLQKIFEGEKDIVFIAYFDPNQYPNNPKISFEREEFFRPYKITQPWTLLRTAANFPVKNLKNQKKLVANASLKQGVPLLAMAFATQNDSNKPAYVLVYLRQGKRIKMYSRSESFTTYLTDTYGNIIVHPDSEKLIKKSTINGSTLLRIIQDSKFETGVQATKMNKEEIIFGYSKIPDFNLVVISEITKRKAFLASQRLIEKSIMFALLIISVSFIVSLVFASKITSSLRTLYFATQEIMKGNFLIQVNVKSNDEVGSLSLSFNRMAGEISRLMQETADKARMEKELETAQIVQDSFFPVNRLEVGDYSVAAFYQPASECGGDWWGHIQSDGKLVILIGDATGHGVPSALITAAAQSCCSTLESIKVDYPNIELSPGLILEKLNNSVFRASRGTVKMSFFCGVIDLERGKIAFANASHEMPLLCKVNEKNPPGSRQKSDVTVCSGNSGLILGHELGSRYEEREMDFRPGEVIALYTDGLIECKNSENQMYGKGRFIRQLYKNANNSSEDLRDLLINDALQFFGERERDDDITLVVIKRRDKAQILPKVS